MEIIAIIISIAGINFALLSWLRADMKQFESKIDSWRSDINNEMKDFHGRLCSIEERQKKD